MNANDNKNNQVTVRGTIVGNPEYSHSVGAEKFLRGTIKVNRLSGTSDMLPFMVSERLAPDWALGDQDEVAFTGQLRSHNVYTSPDEKAKLEVVIFVREISHIAISAAAEGNHSENLAEIRGHLCKQPVYRVTPFGREICDMMIAVHRAYGKSDYIPCIAWGRTARFIASRLKVGDMVKINGRFQSRTYTKTHADGTGETRTVYEVSIFELFA